MTTMEAPGLGMYTEQGDWLLAKALLDALCVPAHQFPTSGLCDWFSNWLNSHPIHSMALVGHEEWTDTDVMDGIHWFLSDPARGLKWLARLGLTPQ